MKTLRLTKPESAAYAAGERRFWRAIKPKPDRAGAGHPWLPYWNVGGYRTLRSATNYLPCPYGTPGDRIGFAERGAPVFASDVIKRIDIEQRDGKWGWLVEVGA